MASEEVKRGGKHKRGERGSTEEEEEVCKRPNMASQDNETCRIDEEGKNKEPTNLELKEMLVDIKIEISNAARESNKFANEIAALRNLIEEQRVELDALTLSVKEAQDKNRTLEAELHAAVRKTDEQQEEIAELYFLQDNLEQYTRKQSLELCGIPDSAYTSTEEAVLQLAEKPDVPMVSEDINISHKIKGKGPGQSKILVKFQSHKAKIRMYKARTKLKNIRFSDVFPTASSATRVAAGDGRIFINENLTSYRKELLKKANDKRKDGLVFSAWSLDGKIFVKTSPEGRPVQIFEKEDLEDL